jgi:hypothetical protein
MLRFLEFFTAQINTVPIPGADEIKGVELLSSEYSSQPTWPQQ